MQISFRLYFHAHRHDIDFHTQFPIARFHLLVVGLILLLHSRYIFSFCKDIKYYAIKIKTKLQKMLLCSVSKKNSIKYCSEKRKYAVNLSSLLAVCLANRQVVEMRWKFSLVCVLALYMLNQSKLYLGRHICLSICLWFYRSNYLCGKYKFQWRCKAETTARLFSFGCNNSSMKHRTAFFG